MHPWGLYLRTEEHNKIQLLIVAKDGIETYMEPVTAAEDERKLQTKLIVKLRVWRPKG